MMRQTGERRQRWDTIPKYTAEFKQRAVEPCRERGCTCADLARGLGCDAGSISDWVRRADASGAAPEQNPFQMAEELRRLKRENERQCRRS